MHGRAIAAVLKAGIDATNAAVSVRVEVEVSTQFVILGPDSHAASASSPELLGMDPRQRQ
jgi:hypothetical protein